MEKEHPKNPEEKQSAISRFVGLSEAEEDSIFENARKIFQKQEKLPIEREKTEKELEIIRNVLAQLPEFLNQYGIDSLHFAPEHVHISDKSSLSEEQKNSFGISEESGGFYMEDRQGMVAFASTDDLHFAERIGHESLHGNSFISFTTSKDGKSTLRRVGLTILDENGRRYFHNLNEALTEELAMRFDKEYSDKMLALSEAVKKRMEFVNLIKTKNPKANTTEIKSVVTEQEADGKWKTIVREYVYQPERKELALLINELYEKNQNKFSSQEEVFRLFVKAAYSGRVLEIARLIESSFGEGAFKKLAESTELKDKTIAAENAI